MAKKNQSLFKDFRLTWWQAGIFKLSAMSFGIILAATFPDFFAKNLLLAWLILLVSAIYILSVHLKKK